MIDKLRVPMLWKRKIKKKNIVNFSNKMLPHVVNMQTKGTNSSTRLYNMENRAEIEPNDEVFAFECLRSTNPNLNSNFIIHIQIHIRFIK